MREMEEVHRQREAEKAASLKQRLSRLVASLPVYAGDGGGSPAA
jgi:hypothetical protein